MTDLIQIPEAPEAPKGLQISDLSRDQREAYAVIVNWAIYNTTSTPILTLGGYAGSGKSTLLSLFAKEPGLEPLAFATYTGKAASVLRKKLLTNGIKTRSRVMKKDPNETAPEGYYETNSMFQGAAYCGTIHGLIYKPQINEETGVVEEWVLRDELDVDYKTIVIDEASMVSDEMLDQLRSYGIQILLVGDHGQLPPVGGFGSYMKRPDVRLETIHRQAENNPIIKLSKVIRETGKYDKRLADGQHIVFDRIFNLNKILVPRYVGCKSLFDIATLCYTNRRRAGTNVLSRTLTGKSGAPKEGEQVICLRNQKDKSIYNGMRGVIVKDLGRRKGYPWQLQAELDFPEDSVHDTVTMCAQQFGQDKTFKDYAEIEAAILQTAKLKTFIHNWNEAGGLFDFGYAITCHKMQGSQAEDVLVISEMPGPCSAEDKRRWMYTAVTRAVQKVTILE